MDAIMVEIFNGFISPMSIAEEFIVKES